MNFFAYVKWLIAVWKKKFSLWRKRRSWSFQSSLRFQLPKCMFCFSNAICDHNPINHKSYWSSRYLYLCTYTRAPIRAKINQCHFGESRLFVKGRPKYALTLPTNFDKNSSISHESIRKGGDRLTVTILNLRILHFFHTDTCLTR